MPFDPPRLGHRLVLHTGSGRIEQHKPFIYQEIQGRRREADGGYVLRGERRSGFQIGAYDPGKPLVIDPVLIYSTFLAGASRFLESAN